MRIDVPIPCRPDWERVTAGRFFQRVSRVPREHDGIVTAFRDGQVTLRSNRRVGGFTNAVQEIGYQGVRAGDLVIHSMDGFAGAIGVSDSDGKASPVVHCYLPLGDTDPRYYAYLLRVLAQRGFIMSLAKGIRERSSAFDVETFRNLVLPRPPLAAQRAIADYLDAETARIDALIARKQQLVHLLEERTKAAIRETTRRGLDPGARLVDSGLPWVGMIPAGWDLRPNRSFMRLVRTLVGAESDLPTLLSLTKRGVVVRDVSENFGKFPASFDTYQHVRPGQLVFCLFDMPETPRTVGLVRDFGMVTGAYDVFEATEGDPRFVDLLYRGYDDEKSLSLFYSGLRNVIQKDRFMSIRAPFPPTGEQRRIADTLERQTAEMSKAAALLEKQVELLGERRRALVSAAVTGQLAVSGVA